jgi:hypothetical protein
MALVSRVVLLLCGIENQLLAMRQVLRDQSYQSDQLRKLVRERLRAVLISAFEHTAYYWRCFPDVKMIISSGVLPGALLYVVVCML